LEKSKEQDGPDTGEWETAKEKRMKKGALVGTSTEGWNCGKALGPSFAGGGGPDPSVPPGKNEKGLGF